MELKVSPKIAVCLYSLLTREPTLRVGQEGTGSLEVDATLTHSRQRSHGGRIVQPKDVSTHPVWYLKSESLCLTREFQKGILKELIAEPAIRPKRGHRNGGSTDEESVPPRGMPGMALRTSIESETPEKGVQFGKKGTAFVQLDR